MFLLDRCDCETLALMERGCLRPFYVIELTILPWRPRGSKESLPPVFRTECGLCYFRGLAGTQRVTSAEIRQIVAERRRARAANKVIQYSLYMSLHFSRVLI